MNCIRFHFEHTIDRLKSHTGFGPFFPVHDKRQTCITHIGFYFSVICFAKAIDREIIVHFEWIFFIAAIYSTFACQIKKCSFSSWKQSQWRCVQCKNGAEGKQKKKRICMCQWSRSVSVCHPKTTICSLKIWTKGAITRIANSFGNREKSAIHYWWQYRHIALMQRSQ